jgi:imidazolonepropionase-like amidohydrolase
LGYEGKLLLVKSSNGSGQWLRIFGVFAFLLSILLPAHAQQYAIHAGTLLDGTGVSARHNVYLTVRDGRVAAISPQRPLHIAIKEFPADTVIPGFVDAHGHITLIGLGEEADAQLVNEKNQEQWVLCNARDALASGVTTLRDPGTYLWTLAMRPRIEATGLRWITAGRQLVKKTTAPNAYSDPMFADFDGVDDARAQVRARKAEGSGFIKLRLTKQRPLPSLEEAKAIVEEAHRLGTRVAVHIDVPYDDAVHLAIAAGVDTIEHNAPLRVADPEKVFAEIVQRGIVVVPGLSNWIAHFEPLWGDVKDIPEEPLRSKLAPILVQAIQARGAELREQDQEAIKNGYDPVKRRPQAAEETLRAFKAGVLLAAGPDTGIDLMPHGRFYKDVEWFLESGIPLENVVQITTQNGARAAGVEKETGSLESGKAADIVALRGDLTKQQDFRHVLLVIRGGRVIFDATEKWAPCTIK